MEEIIICIHGTNTSEVMDALKKGWKVKMISAFSEPITKAEGWGTEHGIYGAYVVLIKEKEIIKVDNHDSTDIDYGCINDKIFKYS